MTPEGTTMAAKSNFEKLVEKLEAKGHSASGARKIAASIGMRKYGAKKMGEMSADSRRIHK